LNNKKFRVLNSSISDKKETASISSISEREIHRKKTVLEIFCPLSICPLSICPKIDIAEPENS